MPWIVPALLMLLVIALTRASVINALEIKRDMNKRFNELRTRLEQDANSVLDDFLANHAHNVRSATRSGESQ
jgi:hypothetical protein